MFIEDQSRSSALVAAVWSMNPDQLGV